MTDKKRVRFRDLSEQEKEAYAAVLRIMLACPATSLHGLSGPPPNWDLPS